MAKKQILVVDDEKDIVEFLTQLLEDNGYEVASAYDGVQGMEMVLESRPDLILLDLMMPVMDGFEFLDRLRGNERWRHLPVVVLTAKILTKEERAFLEQSVAQVVRKGAEDHNALLERITALSGYKQP